MMEASSFNWVAKRDFSAFAQKAFEILNPGTPFEDNWHLHAMTHVLSEMEAGRRRRQIIAMPPRSLKSIMASVAWPAFRLGHNPAERIVAVSYNETLAEKLSLDTRRLMESEFYKEVFPDTRLRKATSLQLITVQGGMRFATSVGGATTGFGGNWLIVDDPLSASEAYSVAERERVKRYYDQTLSSRLDDETTGKILLVMQRLHADDLAGHLLLSGEWDQLKLQARATEAGAVPIGGCRLHRIEAGDLLHARRLPQGVLDEKRRQMGSANFEAQYQQQPVPETGNMIKREWLRYYDDVPDRADGEVVLSVDTAIKTNPENDYSVCSTWLAKGGTHYLLDVWRGKVDFPTLRHKVLDLVGIHRANRLLVEDCHSGSSLIQDLHKMGIAAISRKPRDSKVARLAAASPYIEGGLVWLPRDAPWLAEFITELLGFPGAKHDDQVDSTSQYLAWAAERSSGSFHYDMMLDDIAPEHDVIADYLPYIRAGRWRG